MRSSASQALLPATQRRCTETVAAMARRKRRLAPQRNHTDSVITFYNRDTEKARDKMGNEMKKFRQISTNAHRMGHRRKKTRERALQRVDAKRRSLSFQSPRDGATVLPRVDAKNRAALRGAALPQYIGLFIFSRNILKIYKRREMRYDKEKKEKRR